MNFGPDWLRNMSSDSAPKYKLAEFRYGREEMLALFDRSCKPPEHLSRAGELFIEKTQIPLSLLPMTEDETKLWSRNDFTRPGAKAPPGLPGASLRGRGGSMDRGRGRAKPFFYGRPGYDDPDAKEPNPPFLRSSRSFDRTQVGDRGWPERNGGDPGDWNGSTSPRKEYGPMAGSMTRGSHSQADSNWRKSRTDDQDDGWRQREQKWPRSSWRDESEGGSDGQKGSRTNWGRGWADEGVRPAARDPDYDRRQDEIPEWAQDSVEPSGGSFDASGAFHGGYDEEELGQGEPRNDVKKDPVVKEKVPSPTTTEPPAPEVSRPSPPSAPPEKSASSAAMSDAHSLDRIRARHQNFVTKAEPESSQPVNNNAHSVIKDVKATPAPVQPAPPISAGSRETAPAPRQNSEEDMSRLAVDSVVRLIEDEERERPQVRPHPDRDVWFYKDPNEREQGPFRSSEMLNWYLSGYFAESLLVRRDYEDRFVSLGQLTLANHGRVPFFTSPPHVPPNDPFSFLGPRDTVKMPEIERWHTMSQTEQNVFIQQKIALSQQAMLDPNGMARILAQLQQTNIAPQPHPVDSTMSDSVRTLMMMGAHAPAAHHLPHPGMTHPLTSVLPGVGPTDLQKEDALQRVLLRKQMEASKVSQQQRPPVMDSLWSGPGRPMWANGLANVPVSVPPAAVPRWEMKTEDEIVAEQHAQRLAEEQRKKEEEEKKRKEEEERREHERREDERRRAEEESLRVLLRLPGPGRTFNSGPASRPGSPAPNLMKLQKEREREEEDAHRLLEEQRRKVEEMKRLEEAQRKKEEKERKRRDEIDKKRLEEERRRQEAEANELRLQTEILQQQQEQQRRQEEALRILKEQQMKTRVKPWSQSSMPQASLADIQAQERERKLKEQRERDTLLNLMVAEQNREAQEEKNKSSMNLKWVSNAPPRNVNVKSLAEIQAEEAVKQLEKDRQERTQAPKDVPVTAGIWGAGGLSWGTQNAPWGGVTRQPSPPTAGFWEESPAKIKAKNPQSPTKAKSQNSAGTKKTSVANNVKPAKPKNKKEEAAVLKMFEPQADEFTTWCSQTLHSLNTDLDVPTFTTFLCELESPFEVKDYIKTYLGDSRDSSEFAKTFLERRSRWKESRRANNFDDELCAPAVAINPAQSSDAQDAARKAGKKTKKGKMIKVDTRILGFSVTAAENRTNVGEREYWDSAL